MDKLDELFDLLKRYNEKVGEPLNSIVICNDGSCGILGRGFKVCYEYEEFDSLTPQELIDKLKKELE